MFATCAASVLALTLLGANPVDGNRLAYLDGHDIYYPHANFPKLITPQWVGEDGVEAVVILAIDDMRDPAKYEAYLRPILQRLKQIDGRAPISIMTCAVKPDDPQLQTWLQEGLSLEVHTFDHPCPLLQGGDFAKAKGTYDKCVDLMFNIPNNAPVAFRMPCCDSLNTVSPRFYKEIFNKTTPNGKFLQISSSVFQVYTAADPTIPRELLFDADGKERFRKYFPKGLKRGDQTHDRFVNYIENYPYPYVIDRLCWEFPCMTPSDWEANFLHQPNNPQTVEDMKAALDITVHKQGVLNLVFHPHGWIKAEQVNELIDHAVAKHGKKVKFLTFKEALERLNKNLLRDYPIRKRDGSSNGTLMADFDQDGYLDILLLGNEVSVTRLWDHSSTSWKNYPGPATSKSNAFHPINARLLSADTPSIICRDRERRVRDWQWNSHRRKWEELEFLSQLFIRIDDKKRFDEATLANVQLTTIDDVEKWNLISIVQPLDGAKPFVLHPYDDDDSKRVDEWIPDGVALCDANGNDRGVRFVDVDEDGYPDLIWSGAKDYGIHLFDGAGTGWSVKLLSGTRGSKPADQELPPIVRADGTDNGFFVRDRALHWMNEDTEDRPNLIVSWDFDKLLGDRLPAAKTPRAAVESMRPRPGFAVELMAHEPAVMDPVAFQWGPDGKLWVVEMADYPNGIDGRGQPGGRVRFLEDADGDGQYEKSTLFLDGVPFPNGVHPWKNGVLVSAAPDIFFAADTNGDGTADLREVLYTGFGEGNQQHRVNGFTWGLDGWLYLANGDSGGAITSVKTGEKLDLRGRDLRIHPETGQMDAVTGQSQFGRARDDWGHWFGNNNSRPLFHYVLEDQYLRRNPHYAAPDPRKDVSVQPGNAPVFPASKTLSRFNDFHTANRFTSACSAIVTGELRAESLGLRAGEEAASSSGPLAPVLGGEGRGEGASAPKDKPPHPNPLPRSGGEGTEPKTTAPLSSSGPQPLALSPQLSFVSEPVHNLVHCEVLRPDGVSFTSQRLPDEQQSEFLASTDNWFRPTQLRIGPDGALWIADMYRLVIEHPQWIPQEWQEKLNVRAGDDKGRLWRMYPTGEKPRAVPRLDKLTTAELVAALDSTNRWQRDMAHQLLLERNDKAAVPELEKLLRSDKPQARLQALCVLEGLEALSSETLLTSLRDDHSGVRRWAIRFCAGRAELPNDEKYQQRFVESLTKVIFDSDPSVQLEAINALGEIDVPEFGTALLAGLAVVHESDRYLTAAIFSSLTAQSIQEFATILAALPEQAQLTDRLQADVIAQLVAFDQPEGLWPILRSSLNRSPADWTDSDARLLDRFLTSMATRNHPWKNWTAGEAAALSVRLTERLADAAAFARNDTKPLEQRVRSARLSRYAKWPQADLADTLAKWLQPTQPPELQLAAVELFRSRGDAALTTAVIGRWRELSPNTRNAVREALLSRTSGCVALLDAVAAGTLAVPDFDAATRQRLLDHLDGSLRKRAEELLGATTSQARAEVIARYQPVVHNGGDATRGGELFRKTCAQCHKLGEVGHIVGPDLRSLTDKSPEAMLTAVLDPNRAVETKYLTYTAVTAQGQSFTGLLASETATSLTLLAAEGKEHAILRADLEQLVAANKSLMPEGLEKDFSAEAMADLIAFVRANVPLPQRKEFPGNAPQTVIADADGKLALLPAAAEIYGPTIVLESQHGNLGWWSSADDHAVWTVDVPQSGKYRVEIVWACDPQAAGHRLVIDGGKKPFTHRVTATANWDDYQTATIGEIELDADVRRITLRPASRPLPALMDLKSVVLIPEK
ncbi:MAG: PVC-type heme-binding CxxCH protein [Planctomycetaceae bacterium]|nr:PVC-type heme-binding CxxCH protein [Planctomycetaceae bacterium]